MAKFKKGDRVRAINASCGWGGVKKGDIGVVVDEHLADFPDHKMWSYEDGDLELITPQYKPITPKVGDRYRVVKEIESNVDDNGWGRGEIVEVKGLSSGAVCFSWKEQLTLWTKSKECLTTEYLEPVEEKPTIKVPHGFYDKLKPIMISGDLYKDMPLYTLKRGEITKIKKPNTITKMTNFIKKLTQSADDKVLEKARFMDSCGELTSIGSNALESLVFADYKEKLVALAKEVVAEEKE